MEKKKSTKTLKIIILISIIVIVVAVVIRLSIYFHLKPSIHYYEITGVESPYVMTLRNTQSGSTIGGQKLKGGTYYSYYYIREDDTLWEPMISTYWELNYVPVEDTLNTITLPCNEIIEVLEITDDYIMIQVNNKETKKVRFGQSLSVKSNFQVSDGLQRSYTIEFEKKQ